MAGLEPVENEGSTVSGLPSPSRLLPTEAIGRREVVSCVTKLTSESWEYLTINLTAFSFSNDGDINLTVAVNDSFDAALGLP
jgi:hypothetical protein